jgi:hypothetical protein
VVYVDDPAAVKAQLQELLPSVRRVIADITHVLRRYAESCTPQHSKIGARGVCAGWLGNQLGVPVGLCAMPLKQPTPTPHPTHTLPTADFLRALSNAVFVADAGDEGAVREFHAAGSRTALSEAALEDKGADYWTRRVRRFVRPKAELVEQLNATLAAWQECIDPLTGKQLLTPRTSLVHKAVLDLINADSFCGAATRGRGECCFGGARRRRAAAPRLTPDHPPAFPSPAPQTPTRSTACTSRWSMGRAACRGTSRCAARRSSRASTTTSTTCCPGRTTPPTSRAR